MLLNYQYMLINDIMKTAKSPLFPGQGEVDFTEVDIMLYWISLLYNMSTSDAILIGGFLFGE